MFLHLLYNTDMYSDAYIFNKNFNILSRKNIQKLRIKSDLNEENSFFNS